MMFSIRLEGNILSFCAVSFSTNGEQSQLKFPSFQYQAASRTVSHPPFYPKKWTRCMELLLGGEQRTITFSTASCHILPATHSYLYYNHLSLSLVQNQNTTKPMEFHFSSWQMKNFSLLAMTGVSTTSKTTYTPGTCLIFIRAVFYKYFKKRLYVSSQIFAIHLMRHL